MSAPRYSPGTAVELLPFPFCGGRANIYENEVDFIQKWSVGCGDCNADLDVCEDERQEAAEVWNTRAPQPAGLAQNVPSTQDDEIAGLKSRLRESEVRASAYCDTMKSLERELTALQETRGDEQVAWRYRFVTSVHGDWSDWFIVDSMCSIPARDNQVVQPLYAVPQQSPRLAERLTDVVMMLDTPDAYNREYIAAVCRSPDTTVVSSTSRCEVGK